MLGTEFALLESSEGRKRRGKTDSFVPQEHDLTWNRRYKSMIKKILVATDGSEHSDKVVELASDMALKYNAKIYLIHVVNEPKVPESVIINSLIII